jgi:2'-5' RNA ligase
MEKWENWQKPYQFGTIVIWPPDSVRAIVNSQREKYDPASQAICETHITVTQPFYHWPDQAEWKKIQEVLREYHQFEIHFGPLTSFLPYPCIYYEIRPGRYIVQMRDALHQLGLFNLEMRHPKNFIPHMTITEGLSGPEVDEGLLKELQRESGKGSFICRELSYIVPDDRFHFHVSMGLPLSPSGV